MVLPLACHISAGGQASEEILTLEIARDSVPCVGEMRGMCIQVRSPGEEEWRKFYDPIAGFQHKKGTAYIVEVGRRDVPNPPADGSAFRYRLIRIVEEDPGGARTLSLAPGTFGGRFQPPGQKAGSAG